jgi:hypothetical protein
MKKGQRLLCLDSVSPDMSIIIALIATYANRFTKKGSRPYEYHNLQPNHLSTISLYSWWFFCLIQ